jgi:hypothetical protein
MDWEYRTKGLTRREPSLRDTESEPDSGKFLVISSSSGASGNNTPSDTKTGKVERRSNSSDNQVGRDFEENIRDEEDE